MTTKSGQDIRSLLSGLAEQVDRAIVACCDSMLDGPPVLLRAMRYSLEAGGKRFRPALVLLASRACGGRDERAMPPAVAMEMVHTFSLIHDDLPAMDDDDLRRGKPTNHKMFGEAMAILAGDALVIFAFELLVRSVSDGVTAARMVGELAQASGAAGMTGGQALDIEFDSQAGEVATAERIHLLKTAALIRCSARLGGLAAGADPATVDGLGDYGRDLGLAFQIADDLLDLDGCEQDLGKRTGKDEAAGKPNYALLVGAEQARRRASALVDQAVERLRPLGPAAEPLALLARFVIDRSH